MLESKAEQDQRRTLGRWSVRTCSMYPTMKKPSTAMIPKVRPAISAGFSAFDAYGLMVVVVVVEEMVVVETVVVVVVVVETVVVEMVVVVVVSVVDEAVVVHPASI